MSEGVVKKEKVAIPFVLGVSGRMDIPKGDEEVLKKSFLETIDWIRGKQKIGLLGRGLGYGDGPILLLTSLAPGADQLVARWAKDADCQVKAPLPFPADLYRDCSTFKRGDEKDEVRQASFDDWIDKLGEDNTFVVWREEDGELSSQERWAQQERDVHDRGARNARYRAAGEYVSTYCDLLLAFTGGAKAALAVPQARSGLPEDYQSGTDWIVRSHLQGRLPGVLPIQATLNSADNGAVIRIYTRRTEEEDGSRVGEMESFAPQDYPDFDPDCRTAAEMEKERLQEHVKCLRGFSQEVKRLRNAEQDLGQTLDDEELQIGKAFRCSGAQPFHPVLRPKPKSKVCSTDTLALLKGLPRLKETVVLRRWAAHVNRNLDGEVKQVKSVLFVLASIVVTLGIVSTGLSSIAIFRDKWGATFVLNTFGLAIVIAGWSYYWLMRKVRQIFDRQNDTRALAEALRVQMYWMAAGTGQSVASRYLQRARGTVSWIRAGVSCRAFPYEESQEAFQHLKSEGKLQVLRSIRNGWICEQEEYFGRKAHEFQQKQFKLKAVVLMLSWTGVGLTLLARSGVEKASIGPALIWLGAFGALIGLCGRLFPQAWLANELPGAGRWYAGRNQARQLKRFLMNPLLLPAFLGLFLSIAVRCLLGLVILVIPEWFSIADLTLFARNLCFAASALSLSWMGLMFWTENARRYCAMEKVFAGARRRFDHWLGKLEKEKEQSKEFEKTLAKCHLLLTELGCEAIHENLDWLQMHRRKPVEPFFLKGED